MGEQRQQTTEGAEHAIWTSDHLLETRLWASFRAQTLARTVEGMMYYEAALQLQRVRRGTLGRR